MRALAAIGLAALLALGCEGQKPAPPGAASTASTANTASAASPASAASASPSPTQVAAANQVPAEEDYEERAESTITPANADQELIKLEKEIGQ